jgi:hypothetical protein
MGSMDHAVWWDEEMTMADHMEYNLVARNP